MKSYLKITGKDLPFLSLSPNLSKYLSPKLSPGGIEHRNHCKFSFFQDCLTLEFCIIIHMLLIKAIVNTVSKNTLKEAIFAEKNF